jgi:alkaline phosphatase D
MGMRRREFLHRSSLAGLGYFLPGPRSRAADLGADSRQATGVKIGEVSPDSAIGWMRLTATGARRSDGVVRRGPPQPFPENLRIEDLEGSCPGAPGRLRLVVSTREDLNGARRTDWADASPASDFTRQFPLSGLRPDTVYYYAAETAAASGKLHEPLRGRFRTAPRPQVAAPVMFTLTTCQKYSQLDHEDGFHIYDSMLRLDPRFFISAGDIVYYDSDDPKATTTELARYHWQRMFSFPRLQRMTQNIAGYWEKDDHDTLTDDTWPAMQLGPEMKLTFQEGLKIFREQVPMGPMTYRTFRWGKTLQIWLVEGRDYRSPNTMPDGPEKTIWGKEQKEWLQKTLLASDADWRILVSPTPIVGPDRLNKRDNHSNRSFAHEGREFREWAQASLGDNFVNLNGDRHWQYHSVHPETGTHEFSAGPASDSHAAGSPGEDQRFHRFHRMLGGFLQVETTRSRGESHIHFRHRDVHGKVVYEFTKSRRV